MNKYMTFVVNFHFAAILSFLFLQAFWYFPILDKILDLE